MDQRAFSLGGIPVSELSEQPTVDPATLAREVRPMVVTDIGEWKDKPDPHFEKVLNDYFEQFCVPIVEETSAGGSKQFCPACGEHFGGLMANFGLGVGIEWGLIHGEGHCSGCKWPYRGHHRIYDPEEYDRAPEDAKPEPLLTISNLFLAYLPEKVRGWKPPVKEFS